MCRQGPSAFSPALFQVLLLAAPSPLYRRGTQKCSKNVTIMSQQCITHVPRMYQTPDKNVTNTNKYVAKCTKHVYIYIGVLVYIYIYF